MGIDLKNYIVQIEEDGKLLNISMEELVKRPFPASAADKFAEDDEGFPFSNGVISISNGASPPPKRPPAHDADGDELV